MVVVVEVLVAQRQAKHPLADQRADLMLDQLGVPMIREALRKPVDQTFGSEPGRMPSFALTALAFSMKKSD
jgi:hypothetical protein